MREGGTLCVLCMVQIMAPLGLDSSRGDPDKRIAPRFITPASFDGDHQYFITGSKPPANNEHQSGRLMGSTNALMNAMKLVCLDSAYPALLLLLSSIWGGSWVWAACCLLRNYESPLPSAILTTAAWVCRAVAPPRVSRPQFPTGGVVPFGSSRSSGGFWLTRRYDTAFALGWSVRVYPTWMHQCSWSGYQHVLPCFMGSWDFAVSFVVPALSLSACIVFPQYSGGLFVPD